MKVRAERDDLADLFARAGRAVGQRSALPILQGVLCEAVGGTLRVTGTDLEMSVRTRGEVEVLEEGRTVLAARLATEAIRKLPPGAVTVSAGDGEVELAGNGPQFRLRELQEEEFPRLTEPDLTEATEMDGELLQVAVNQVAIAASGDTARPILTGVLFEGEEQGLRLVATDSYRLAVRELAEIEMPSGGLVPARGLRELGRTVMAQKVRVAVGEREAGFSSDRGTLAVRLIEGAFPNYRQLLPEKYPNRMVVSKEGLLEALGRAGLVAEEHIPVRLQLGADGIEVSVLRQDVGGETEFLEGSYEGEEVTIAFNPRYLSEGVGVVEGEEVHMEVLDGLKPAVIRGEQEDFRYLVMPVRT